MVGWFEGFITLCYFHLMSMGFTAPVVHLNRLDTGQ